MGNTIDKKNRKVLLWISLTTNLGILGLFKYFNFFIDSLNELLTLLPISVNLTTLNILLPVGISFYTFQSLSYTIDIYQGKLKPTTDIFLFFSYVAFFPQLVAGPIERADRLLRQFQEKKQFSYSNSVGGLRLVLWGMFQKIVIADNFGMLVDAIFDIEAPLSGGDTLVGALFFAFQIYADFAGYSNIAIGLSKMLGIELMKNFSSPYCSNSLKEFWCRWHISLSSWFKDYVYIPLGGNKGKPFRRRLNLLLTFIISGIWHGANFTFLIWGALHGLLLLLEKQFNIRSIHSWSPILVFFLVTLLWIPFRAESLSHLMSLSQSIINFDSYSFDWTNQVIHKFSVIKFEGLITVLLLFLKMESQLKVLDFSEWLSQKNTITRISSYYFLLFTILLLGNFEVTPHFIYFQF